MYDHSNNQKNFTDCKDKCQLLAILKPVDFKQVGGNKRRGWVYDFIFCLKPGEIHDGLDEDGVISYIGVFRVQLGERTEEWAATGNVHIADGPLEG